MDYKIVWSDRSLTHFTEIVQFIAENNPAAARKMGGAMLYKASFLVQHPRLGKIYNELNRDDIREIPAPPYRIFYQIIEANKTISILAV
jgi:plasmid stabilization system protein ParE